MTCLEGFGEHPEDWSCSTHQQAGNELRIAAAAGMRQNRQRALVRVLEIKDEAVGLDDLPFEQRTDRSKVARGPGLLQQTRWVQLGPAQTHFAMIDQLSDDISECLPRRHGSLGGEFGKCCLAGGNGIQTGGNVSHALSRARCCPWSSSSQGRRLCRSSQRRFEVFLLILGPGGADLAMGRDIPHGGDLQMLRDEEGQIPGAVERHGRDGVVGGMEGHVP